MKTIEYICDPCGTKYGKWFQGNKYTGPSSYFSTCHIGQCDICKTNGVSVTEPRDYGYLVEWKLKMDFDLHEKDNSKRHRKNWQKNDS